MLGSIKTSYEWDWADAVSALTKALVLDPEHPEIHEALGRVLLAQGHLEQALAEMEKEPDAGWHLFGLAIAYYALDNKKESDAAAAEFIRKNHEGGAYQIAEIYSFRGESDRAFEWLNRAYDQRDSGLTFITGDPLLNSIQGDRRYHALLKKMRLPV